jgi:5-methylcytosine-specific restriction protein A
MPTAPPVFRQPYSGAADRRKRHDAKRGNSAQRGYNTQWKKARAAWLAEHPLCVACEKRGVVKAATVVDHIVPHRGDPIKFWDSGNNWCSLCVSCHNRKTASGE